MAVAIFMSLSVLAADDADPIRLDLGEQQLRLFALAEKPDQASDSKLEVEKAKLGALAHAISLASNRSDAKVSTAEKIQEYGHAWLANQSVIYSVYISQFHLGRVGSLAKADLVLKNSLRLNKNGARFLIGDLPFNARHLDVGTVEFFLLEQDKQVAEYGTLIKEEIPGRYPKMIQLASVRSALVNRWSVNRMGQEQSSAPLRSCAPSLASFRMGKAERMTETKAFRQLESADRYLEWTSPEVQAVALKATQTSTLLSADKYRDLLSASIEKTEEYRQFFFDFTSDEEEAFLKKAGEQIAAHESDSWARSAEEVIFRSVLPGDDLATGKLAQRVSVEAFDYRAKGVIQQAITVARQTGAKDLAKVSRIFHAELERISTQWMREQAGRVAAAVAFLDTAQFKEKENRKRAKERIEEFALLTERFVRNARDMDKVSARSDLKQWKDTVPGPELGLEAKITNPAELKDQFMAMLDLPENEELKGFFLQNEANNLMVEFFRQTALRFEREKVSIEEAAAYEATLIQAKNPPVMIDTLAEKGPTENVSKSLIFTQKPVASDNTRIAPRNRYIPSAGYHLANMLELLNLKGKSLSRHPLIVRTYRQHYAYNASKIGKLITAVPLLQVEWVGPEDIAAEEEFRKASAAHSNHGFSSGYVPRLPAAKTAKPTKAVVKLGRYAFDEKTKQVKRDQVRRFIKEAAQEVAMADKGKLETYCQANLNNVDNDENFRKLFRSATAIRRALKEVFPEFVEQDKELMKRTRTGMEVWTDRLMMGFVVIGITLLVAFVIVYTGGAAASALGGLVTLSSAVLAASPKLFLVLSIASVHATLHVSYYEKPIQVAYLESAATAHLLNRNEVAPSVLSGAFESEDPFYAALSAGITNRADVEAAKKQLKSDKTWAAVFAALDALYVGQAIKVGIGLKAAMSLVNLRNTFKQPLAVAHASEEAAKTLIAQTRKSGSVKTTLKNFFSGESFAWFRPIVTTTSAKLTFALKAGELLGDDLTKAIRELEDLLRAVSARIDEAGKLKGGMTAAELVAHPEATQYAKLLRTIRGKSPETMTEILRKNVLEPGETLLQKMRLAQAADAAALRAALGEAGASADDLAKLAAFDTRGELLMLSVSGSPRELTLMKRLADGESAILGFLGYYRLQGLLGRKQFATLSGAFNDFTVVQKIVRDGIPAQNAAKTIGEQIAEIAKLEESGASESELKKLMDELRLSLYGSAAHP